MGLIPAPLERWILQSVKSSHICQSVLVYYCSPCTECTTSSQLRINLGNLPAQKDLGLKKYIYKHPAAKPSLTLLSIPPETGYIYYILGTNLAKMLVCTYNRQIVFVTTEAVQRISFQAINHAQRHTDSPGRWKHFQVEKDCFWLSRKNRKFQRNGNYTWSKMHSNTLVYLIKRSLKVRKVPVTAWRKSTWRKSETTHWVCKYRQRF